MQPLPQLPPGGRAAVAEVKVDRRGDAEEFGGAHADSVAVAGYDAVVQVRLVNASTRKTIERQPRELKEAVETAMRRTPFRSVEIDL